MVQAPAACDAHGQYYEFWANLDFFAATACPFTDLLGTPLTALFFFGAIGMGFWMFSDSVSLPVAIAFIFGSTALVHLPAQAVSLGGIVVILAVAIGAYLLWHRMKEA